MGGSQAVGEQSFVLAFDSTHAAMAAQAAFKAAGASFALIPTPREISAGCGMSLKFKAADAAEAQAFVADTVTGDAAKCATLYEAAGYTKLS
ncbi:DUF3343 domain-containing protein [uncultured Ellagibacter sp.]|uniref:DUF3343 domain-containing protein n=1 Tax=uncultured Ellagibacter sp. TaxID=2137580 RepID=UPI0026124F7D|nr:DUF3343 domain-containing protein [uncultured Ellagibacter sp.]